MFAQVMRFALKRDAWGALEELDRRWQTEQAPQAPGFKGSYLLREQGAPNRCVLIALFESAEHARQNSARPETNAFYESMLKLVDGQVHFIDTDVVTSYLL
jgi:quinol monooxygenase YgiN